MLLKPAQNLKSFNILPREIYSSASLLQEYLIMNLLGTYPTSLIRIYKRIPCRPLGMKDFYTNLDGPHIFCTCGQQHPHQTPQPRRCNSRMRPGAITLLYFHLGPTQV